VQNRRLLAKKAIYRCKSVRGVKKSGALMYAHVFLEYYLISTGINNLYR